MTAIEFCKHVNTLIARGIQLTEPTDEQRRGMFITLQNRVNLVTSLGPEHLVEKIGPALYKYKEQIKNRDEEFFMNLKIIPPANMKEDSANMLVVFGDSIRKMYVDAKKGERDSVYKTVKTILKLYVTYMLERK